MPLAMAGQAMSFFRSLKIQAIASSATTPKALCACNTLRSPNPHSYNTVPWTCSAADLKFLFEALQHTRQELQIEKRHWIQIFASALWFPKFVTRSPSSLTNFGNRALV